MSSSRTPDYVAGFGRLAARYDQLRPADEHWQQLFHAMDSAAGLAGRILDVGCGTGTLLAALAGRGRVFGVDASPEMLAAARRKAPRAGLKEGRAEALPFKDGWFDRVVFQLVLHLVDRPKALAEAHRVLAPGGRIVIATFDRRHFGRFWLSRYLPSLEAVDSARFPTREELERELSAAGFGPPSFRELRQDIVLDRETALRRLRERHISTFELIDEAEYEAGLAKAEEELPDRVEYTRDHLIVVADR
jgi:SAM-dependent methyltransferase